MCHDTSPLGRLPEGPLVALSVALWRKRPGFVETESPTGAPLERRGPPVSRFARHIDGRSKRTASPEPEQD